MKDTYKSRSDLIDELRILRKEIKQLKKNHPAEQKITGTSQKNLSGTKDFYGQVVQNSPNPIFAIDEKGKLIYWNKACRIFQNCEEDALGKKYTRFLAGKQNKKELDSIISDIFNKKKKKKLIEISFLKKNGELFIANSGIYPIVNNKKEIEACIFINTDITNLKQVEKELHDSSEKFRAVAESSHDVIMRFDRNYKHLYANPIVYKQTGIKAKQFIGKTHEELGFPEELVKVWEEAIQKVFDTGKPNRIEFKLPTDVWIDWLLVPEFSRDGKVQYVLTTARDITEKRKYLEKIKKLNLELEQKVKDRTAQLKNINDELVEEVKVRKKVEKELRESEKRYRSIFNSLNSGLIISDKKGKIVEANPTACNLYGYKYEEFLKINIRDLIDPESSASFVKILRELKNKKSVFYEARTLRKDSVPLYIEAYVNSFEFKGRTHFIMSIVDVTKRKLSERKLADREENYRALFNFMPSGILLEDLEGNILDANPTFCNMMGYEKEELLNMNIRDFAPAGQKEKIERNLKYLKENKYLRHTVTNYKKDGSLIYLDLSETKISLAYGGEFILVIANDVTEQKLTYQRLRENEHRYRTLFDTSPSGIIVQDGNGMILDVNPAMCNSLGYQYEEIIGKPVSFIFPEESLANGNHSKNKEQITHEIFKLEKKDGSVSYFEVNKTVFPLLDSSEGILTTINDVTDRINYEKELIRSKEEAEKSNRLKSEFLAQMSHEIRSPINVILNFVSLLKQELEECGITNLKDYFDSIDRGGRRIIKTIDMILNMSELQTGVFEVVPKKLDLENEIIKSIIKEYERIASAKKLDLELKVRTKQPEIIADSYSVMQLFSNLVDNAIKYTEQGGIKIEIFRNTNSEICVSVADTGIGISENYLPNLFEPFTQEDGGYTRKYEGTGLGLALVKQYCTLNNAEISVKSEKGKGTEFVVTFKNQPPKK